MEAVLQTSYELLSADLRQKWRCLAAFPGSFDVKAAGAVWHDGRKMRPKMRWASCCATAC